MHKDVEQHQRIWNWLEREAGLSQEYYDQHLETFPEPFPVQWFFNDPDNF